MKQRWNRLWSRLSGWSSALGLVRGRRWPLFQSILFWVALSLVAYTFLGWVWGTGAFFSWERALTSWRIGDDTNPLDRVKVTLTALGGVGAVGYLVIKYRERAALERGEADEKLLRAVQQLGDASPQMRIAGVYALADVADTFEGPYHQRVVDILCGYLRTDRLLKDSNGETRHELTEDGSPDDGKPLSNDGAVESTILSVLASHLRAESHPPGADTNAFKPGPWSQCTVDLHDTIFTEKANLSRLFLGDIDLSGTTFTQYANFSDTEFKQHADFSDTTFTQYANFSSVAFTQYADFSSATFTRDANFSDTKFTQYADFRRSTFTRDTRFSNTTFTQYADFSSATFTRDTDFSDAKFRNDTDFRNTIFERISRFEHAVFNVAKRGDQKYLTTGNGIPAGALWGEFNEDGELVRVLPTEKES